MNKYRELAAAIRKGHTMIGETKLKFIHHPGLGQKPCGCALGAAWVGAGKKAMEFWRAGRATTTGIGIFADGLGIPLATAKQINDKHCSGIPRLQIADWLDTLADDEEGKLVREDDLAYAKRKVAELMETVTA